MKYENFNDAEALKIAINTEEEGLEFYTLLMKNARDPGVKEVFSKLASDEKEHLRIFQKAFLELSSLKDVTQSCEDYSVDLYLKYLIDTGIFTKKGAAKNIVKEIHTDADGIKIGIQAEKDSILYYTEAAKNTKHPAGKATFGQLANEEKKHLKMLAEQLRLLNKAH